MSIHARPRRISPAARARQQDRAARPRRAADHLVDWLARAGVKYLFTLPGGPIAPINDALLDRPEIRAITVRHENHAVFAAAGYARTSGALGVVLVTAGPGILNAMTGLASAFCDGIPLLVLVGDVPRRLHGKRALQDSDHLGVRTMLRAITQWTAEVPDAHAVIPMLQRAVQHAMTGPRGPVALTLPMDILSTPASPIDLAVVDPPATSLSPAAVEPVAAAIRDAERGVILAGSGVRIGDGPAQLIALAERAGWPVMTTPKAKGVFPDDHPLSLGVFGMAGHPSAYRYLDAGVDVVLAIGTSLGDLATDGWSDRLKPRRTWIQVDLDCAQIGRNYPADIAIAAPADAFLRDVTAALAPRVQRLPHHGVSYHQDPETAGNGPGGAISPVRAVWEIQQLIGPDAIYCVDSGEHCFFATHYLRINQPDGFIAMTGLGSMASSISALGAKLARPDRPVAAICGDGGFAMMATEIATAARHGWRLVFFVFNDMRLGMVELGHERLYDRSPRYDTGPLDIPGVARAVGARTAVVHRAGELLALDLDNLCTDGPAVIDIRIDRQITMPKNQRFETLKRVANSNQLSDRGASS